MYRFFIFVLKFLFFYFIIIAIRDAFSQSARRKQLAGTRMNNGYSKQPSDVLELYVNDVNIKNAKYVIFDFETNSLSQPSFDIIKFAAIKIKNGRVMAKKQFFINIHKPLSDEVKQGTSITDKDIKSGIELDQAVREMKVFVDDSILVPISVDKCSCIFLTIALGKFGLSSLNTIMVNWVPMFIVSTGVVEGLGSLKWVAHKCGIPYSNYEYITRHNDKLGRNVEVLTKIFLKLITHLYEKGVHSLLDWEIFLLRYG